LDARLWKHALCHVQTDNASVKVGQVSCTLNLGFEGRLDFLGQELLSVNVFEKGVPKHLFHIVLLAKALLPVFLK
jgi:hypothetical protein